MEAHPAAADNTAKREKAEIILSSRHIENDNCLSLAVSTNRVTILPDLCIIVRQMHIYDLTKKCEGSGGDIPPDKRPVIIDTII